MILLNKLSILQLLDDKTLDLTVVQSIESTNNAFDSHAPTKKFSACLAEEQTQGRGQFQRLWHSPVSENIYLSLCYYSSKTPAELSGLSLVVGYAICTVLNTLLGSDKIALIKWPNDILCNASKIAGVLIETKKMLNGTRRVVIGVGLNVNMQQTDNTSISQAWTSLIQLTGISHDRNIICATLINQLLAVIPQLETKGFSFFLPVWNHHNALLNQTIQLHHNQVTITGKCVGVSPHAELMLELPNGEITHISSGEISVKHKAK